ncbi:MAG: hypothetical protein H3C59_03225 [Burkholderiaceae bacterium]|nr:hypothetical protein [Burkholderiaceae bacterium]MCD6673592.1 hypothetical protein [Burkholderiaceae bacterium]
MESVQNPDPRFHVDRLAGQIDELVRHLRDDANQVVEPKAQALFETSAEVLIGLRTALSHYRQGSEPAMRPTGR